jgi:hypothetical protein
MKKWERFGVAALVVAALAGWVARVDAQVTARITANNGYAFGFGSASAVGTAGASAWVWNEYACDISCCSGWETYTVDSATLAGNEYAYILAAGDGDSRTSLSATFLDSLGGIVLNTNTTGGEWQACDLGAQSGASEPTGGWVAFANSRIPGCSWVGLTTGWDGGNSCGWSPAPQWVWGAGLSPTSRRVLFRTRTTEITPPACVDSGTGVDTGCTAALPNCIGAGPTARCVDCVTAADCDDGRPCTIDSCTASNECSYASVARGQRGGCTLGFVCTGLPRFNVCVDCIDDQATTVDSGCGRTAEHCRTTGTGAPVCEVCIDNDPGTGTDLGCTGALPNCVLGRGGAYACVACTSAMDCDDGNPCTVDACLGSACRTTPVAVGTPCAGGVCNGASTGAQCLPCVDTMTGAGIDLGCTSGSPLCLVGDDGVPGCQPCEDVGAGMADLGCNDTNPACVTTATGNACAPCEDSASAADLDDGCTTATPICAVGTAGMAGCVGCVTDADCSGATPFCDLGTSTCGGCRTDGDCPVTDPVCSGAPLACGPCTDDTSCAAWPETPICDESSGDCVALPEVDAGVPEVDAGAPEVDAGEPVIDAGAPDAGDRKGVLAGGACGCTLPGTRGDRGAAFAAAVLALAALVRGRRRR